MRFLGSFHTGSSPVTRIFEEALKNQDFLVKSTISRAFLLLIFKVKFEK